MRFGAKIFLTSVLLIAILVAVAGWSLSASSYAANARAWRETLGQLLAREQEAARIRQDMERLTKSDLDLERRVP